MALDSSLAEGTVIACEVVWAEVAGLFPSAEAATEAMTQLGIDFSPMDRASALRAGSVWKTYRRRGGRRQRMIADFLIGAHAVLGAERLLTRDRGFYRGYFRQLPVVDPAEVQGKVFES